MTYDKIPERNASPKVKHPEKIAYCPYCGSRDIQVVRKELVYSWIESWDGDKPEKIVSEYREQVKDFQLYYCPACDSTFNEHGWHH